MSILKRNLSILLAILMIAVSVLGQGTVSYAGGVEEEGDGTENGAVTETQIVGSWNEDGFYPASFQYAMQNLRLQVTFENGETEIVSYWGKNWGSEYGGFISNYNYPNTFYAYFYDKEGNQVKVSDDYVPLGEYTMKIFKEDVEIFEKDIKFLNPEIGNVTSNEVSFLSNQNEKYEETWYPVTLEGGKTYNFNKKDWNTSSPSCFVSMWKMNDDNTVSRVGDGTSSMYSDLLFQYAKEEAQSFYLVVGETYRENTQSGKVFWNEQRVVQSIDVQPASSYKVWNRDIYEIPMKITYADGTTEIFDDWYTYGAYVGGEYYNTLKAETQNGDEFFLAAYNDGEIIDFPTVDGWSAGTFTCKAYSEKDAELQDDFQIEVSSVSAKNLELKEGSFETFGASSGEVCYVCTSPESQTLEVTNNGANQLTVYMYIKNERGLWESKQTSSVSAASTRKMNLYAQTETLIIVKADEAYSGNIGLYVQGQTVSAEVSATEVDMADLSAWSKLPIKVNFACSDGVTPAGSQTIASWDGSDGVAYARTKYSETIYYTLNNGTTQIAVPVLSEELEEWLAGCDSEEERQAILDELKYYLGVESLEVPAGTYTVKVYKSSVQDSNLIGTGTIKVVDKSVCTTHKWDSGKTTKAATCKATGVKTYTCTVCKETKTETIAMKSHSYAAATCTTPKTCKTCGATEGSELGHSYTNACDKSCNRSGCGATRTISHTYEKYLKKATLTADGQDGYKCSVCGYVTSTTKTVYYPKTIKLSTSSYTYSGSVKSPSVVVEDSQGNALKKDTDYTVTMPSGRKDVGTYTYKVTFKGKYSGTKNLTLTIKPQATAISSITAGGRSFTVKWNEITSQATGYQIYYATKSDFSDAKKVYVTNVDTVSKKFTSLTAGTKYYVKVRTYKTVGDTKYYSAWSSVKTVTPNPVSTSILSLTAGGRSFTVKWNEITSNATGYQIYYATKSDFSDAKKVYVTSTDTVSKKFTSLTAGTKYYVKVRTYKTVGNTKYYSAWSSVKTVIPNPVSTSISSLTAGERNFTVKWNEVTSNATGYQIYYATKSDFSNAKKVYVTSASTTSKKISSLTTGTKYYVKVRTYKAVGDNKYYSAWSATKTITVK